MGGPFDPHPPTSAMIKARVTLKINHVCDAYLFFLYDRVFPVPPKIDIMHPISAWGISSTTGISFRKSAAFRDIHLDSDAVQ